MSGLTPEERKALNSLATAVWRIFADREATAATRARAEALRDARGIVNDCSDSLGNAYRLDILDRLDREIAALAAETTP